MMESLYFEVHVSIKYGPQKAREILGLVNVRVSQIVGDEPDIIVTFREKTLNGAVKGLANITTILANNHVEITRHKIEMAIIDSNVSR